MLVNLALDRKASLVFQLKSVVQSLRVHFNTTAVSADPQPDQSFQLFTGPIAESLEPGQIESWTMQYDGPTVQFSTALKNPQTFLKLHYCGDLGTVITSAHFSTL